jgi:Tfp pilus assembly protein PilO
MVKLTKNKISYLVILFVSYSLIFIALYFILGRNLLGRSESLKDKLTLQTKEINETKDLVKAIPNPEKEIASVEDKIKELRDKAVTKEQVPRIIQQLTRKSSDLNINIISIKPLTQAEDTSGLAQAVNKVYIEVEMSCPYSAMGDYLKALTELPILFTVESINIQKKEEEPGSRGTASTKGSEVIVNLLLSTYMVLEI